MEPHTIQVLLLIMLKGIVTNIQIVPSDYGIVFLLKMPVPKGIDSTLSTRDGLVCITFLGHSKVSVALYLLNKLKLHHPLNNDLFILCNMHAACSFGNYRKMT